MPHKIDIVVRGDGFRITLRVSVSHRSCTADNGASQPTRSAAYARALREFRPLRAPAPLYRTKHPIV